MGLTLYAYRVDLDALRNLPRTDDPAFAALRERLAPDLAELDEELDDVKPSAAKALEHLCDGRSKRRSEMHGYVLEAVCRVVGQRLDNTFWEHFSVSFFSKLDDALTARGLVGEDAWVEIIQSGVPVLGMTCRRPECGAAPPEQVARVGRIMDAMDLSKLKPEQREGAAVFRSWLREAEEHGQALVIFDY